MCTCVHVDTVSKQQIHVEIQKEGRKKEASKAKQTLKQQGRATQHTRGSHFSKMKNELHVPRVGLEPTTLYTLDKALYIYMYIHVHVHVYVNCTSLVVVVLLM